ncbi:hypothetical protein NC651_033471 [Populus alba x Populus x berolinensis]|nr:hypothetical protein NC651_033471 [Populus alba x Populus x berolinensis]
MRLAASILNCGNGKLWLDPNETIDNSMRMVLLSKKSIITHSRSRTRKVKEAKNKRRHSG